MFESGWMGFDRFGICLGYVQKGLERFANVWIGLDMFG